MMCKILIFSCISAVMLMTAAYGAPLSKKSLLTTLMDDLKFLGESKDKIHFDLYTPNDTEECSWQTLQCYLTELSTLENEIEDKHFYTLQNIKKNFQSLMDLITPGTGCKICEANDKKLFHEFHQHLSNFLQFMFKQTS